jgi:hypothetical protein
MSKPTRVLSFFESSLFVQEGNQLLLVDAWNGKLIRRWKIPALNILDLNRQLSRLMRLGIHSLLPLDRQKAIIVTRNQISRIDLSDGSIDAKFSDFRGKRPLFITQTDQGRIYFGEYYNNPERDTVRIFGSFDQGKSFEVVYRFSPHSIRHVHGVFFDPYSNHVWVTTGDLDQESKIMRTGDDFQTLEQVVGGNQKYRAVQLIFTPDYVYFGSDTPLEENYLYRLNRDTNQVESLQEIEGSVFYGCKVGRALFFSTVVEPSRINQDTTVYLWGSEDGQKWHRIKKYPKDPLPLKVFQYGQIRFPVGENVTNRLWFTPYGTRLDQTLQFLPLEEAFNEQN